jgi:hypothetical protein
MWTKIMQSRTGHIWHYGAYALHAGYLRLQTPTQLFNTYCFSTTTMVAWTRLSVTLYEHCLSCFAVRPYSNYTGFVKSRVFVGMRIILEKMILYSTVIFKLRETVTVVCDTTFWFNNCINHTRHVCVCVCFFRRGGDFGGVYSTALPLNSTTASNRRIT